MNPKWTSELVPAMGAIKAEGIRNQLGRPAMDRFAVFVREAAQNSWDAKDQTLDGPVDFALSLEVLDSSTASAWSRIVSEEAPIEVHLPLREALRNDTLSILFVSDRGTSGLGGPTRAGEVSEGEPHDYVSFVLNVGDPRDTEFGGGTYGFGKAVFFLASAASTILVHTRYRGADGRSEARFVGCALGQSFEIDGRAYTGRHWFGLATPSSDIVEPLVGAAADDIARQLGFPEFTEDQSGTTIAVVAPRPDDLSPEAVVDRLAHSILWHLWPKMIEEGDGPAMRFSVSLNGKPVEIPDPANHAALREFALAMRELDDGETITYGVGARPVGKIRLRTIFAPEPVIDEIGQDAGLDTGVHHCCLLRVPELVVEYRKGPPLPAEGVWYAGVFRVFPDLDEIFARAEPPTHDAWVPNELDSREKSLVGVTLRKIDEMLKSHAAPKSLDAPSGGADGLSVVSRMLGALLAPAPGQAATRTGGRSKSRARSSTVRMLGAPEWQRIDGRDVLVQAFEVETKRRVTVIADVAVRVWGGAGAETQPPLGAPGPELIGWRAPNGELHGIGRLAIGPDESGRWEAIVASPPDTATRIRVHEAIEARNGG